VPWPLRLIEGLLATIHSHRFEGSVFLLVRDHAKPNSAPSGAGRSVFIRLRDAFLVSKSIETLAVSL
jgi:hypothetical protein